MKSLLTLLAGTALLAPVSFAQTNSIPGMDAALVDCFSLNSRGHTGTFPSGNSGVSMGVDICNFGSVNIDWRAPMDPRHPMYSFIVARDLGSRFEQISDRSYVKHGFLSINGSICGSCSTSNGSILGPNCSDTYGASLNANTFYLGPPAEIDPWTGSWDPVGSHFDMGFPPVSGNAARDGNRSTISVPGNIQFRVGVKDKDFNEPSAEFYYGLYVIVPREPGNVKENNGVFKRTQPSWNGSSWNFSDRSGPTTGGSILEMWNGASLSSGGNGSNDGRFFVAMKATPNADGTTHYEYAVHNRDNSRGGNSFSIPVCANTNVTNISFRDIDDDASNEWTGAVVNNEIVWTAPQGESLEWNVVYNFAFDADAPSVSGGNTNISMARPGPGGDDITVVIDVPGAVTQNAFGTACGNSDFELAPAGLVSLPTIPNPFLFIEVSGAGANNPVAVELSTNNVTTNLFGCDWELDFAQTIPLGSGNANGLGGLFIPAPIPFLPALEGLEIYFQGAELDPNGALFGAANTSKALRMRIGNNLQGCN